MNTNELVNEIEDTMCAIDCMEEHLIKMRNELEDREGHPDSRMSDPEDALLDDLLDEAEAMKANVAAAKLELLAAEAELEEFYERFESEDDCDCGFECEVDICNACLEERRNDIAEAAALAIKILIEEGVL